MSKSLLLLLALSFCVIPSELSQLVRPLVTFSIIVTSGILLNKVKTKQNDLFLF